MGKASGHDRRQPPVAPGFQGAALGSGLALAVGPDGRGSFIFEVGPVGSAIDFAGADHQESRLGTDRAQGLDEALRAGDVRAEGGLGIVQRGGRGTLRRQVGDGLGSKLDEKLGQPLASGQIPFDGVQALRGGVQVPVQSPDSVAPRIQGGGQVPAHESRNAGDQYPQGNSLRLSVRRSRQ